LPCAVLARVNGPAVGGGVGLIACADVVLAAATATFAFSEVRLGLVPAVIAPFVVSKLGMSVSRRYFLTGERFDAATAKAIGLVHEVVAAELLDTAATAMVETLLRAGPQAVREAKALLRGLEQREMAPLANETAALIARLRVGAEGQEGVGAFLEKRTPSWQRATTKR